MQSNICPLKERQISPVASKKCRQVPFEQLPLESLSFFSFTVSVSVVAAELPLLLSLFKTCLRSIHVAHFLTC